MSVAPVCGFVAQAGCSSEAGLGVPQRTCLARVFRGVRNTYQASQADAPQPPGCTQEVASLPRVASPKDVPVEGCGGTAAPITPGCLTLLHSTPECKQWLRVCSKTAAREWRLLLGTETEVTVVIHEVVPEHFHFSVSWLSMMCAHVMHWAD